MKYAIVGQNGRMGLAIQECMEKHNGWQISSYDEAEVLIDVSSPKGTMDAIAISIDKKLPLVIGTTGHSEEQKKQIKEAAKEIPLLFAANFSFGIYALNKLLNALDMNVAPSTVDIVESHHLHKKDKTSGTALRFKESILKTFPDSILNVHSIRQKSAIGEHVISCGYDEEIIELRHIPQSRKTFAKGAVLAAQYLVKQKPGLYTMKDVYEKS